MEAILNQILVELKIVKADVGNLKTDIQEVKTDIGYLKADMQEVKTDIGNLKSDMQIVKLRQDESFQFIHAIRHNQELTNAKIEGLAMDVHSIHGVLTALKDGQERQDRILESLAMRSLEQETDIRELKRIK
jgi:chromosome segregation ATPase